MIIRATEVQDWDILRDVRLAALLDAPTAFGLRHATAAAYTEAQWRDRAAGRSPAEYLLALVDGVAAGMVGHYVADNGECNLIGMWVRPEYRGRQVAAALVAAVKARATAKGHSRIVLDVSPDNARAAAFYRRQGFVFLPVWEPLDSHPHISVQKMEWLELGQANLTDSSTSSANGMDR